MAAILRGTLLAGTALFAAGCGAEAPVSMSEPGPSHTPDRGTSTPETAPSLEKAGLPTLAPDSVTQRVPSRVTMPGFGIDLPVVAPPPDPNHFPYCDVAEYLPTLSRPGRPGTTYIYAHARPGMFLPILEASTAGNGQSMVGMTVHVFTSDDRRFTYTVTEVLRHVESLEAAFRATREQLILQTSEGPPGTPGKTLLIALPADEQPAAPSDARPPAHPTRCL